MRCCAWVKKPRTMKSEREREDRNSDMKEKKEGGKESVGIEQERTKKRMKRETCAVLRVGEH